MAKTRVIDRGWLRIKTACQELEGEGVKVGVRAGGGGGREVDGVRIIDYAVWNEFGTTDGRVPSRPFMRRSADTSRNRLPNFLRQVADRVISKRATATQALTMIGLFYQSHIRDTIRESPNWAKPNSPLTIAIKGSSVPLIDTGSLHGAIDYERIKK